MAKERCEDGEHAFVYRHPLLAAAEDDALEEHRGVEVAKTLAELRMMHLSWAIREKRGWQLKLKRKDIVDKWKIVAISSQQKVPNEDRLTENMINYVFTELEAYARLTEPKSEIQHACNDITFYSYSLIPTEVSRKLRSGVSLLEDIPDTQKDWHPGSDGQVLDLVHPSLYCLVYGDTLVHGDSSVHVSLAPTENDYVSDEFAWLPSDFKVEENGTVHLVSPYINNLHRSNHDLYSAIPQILSSFVPMFERVLGGIKSTSYPPTLEGVLDLAGGRNTSTASILQEDDTVGGRIEHGAEPRCIWGNFPYGVPYDHDAYSDEFSAFPGDTFNERYYAWQRSRNIILPEAHESYQGALEADFHPANIRGRTVQCIVKLANICLSPDKPQYPGGNWHVEGMLNERIVATGIYYYDCENISESQLEFRTSISEVSYHQQDDALCMQILYGLNRNDALVQERGSISTCAGLALAFPNIYQHRVSPFHLIDPTKSGHRKILAFFLVDPNIKIPSASTVAPQQEEWILEFMHDFGPSGIAGTYLERIPIELRDTIVAKTPGLMNRQRADEVRLQLMEERSRFVDAYNEEVMEQEFNMCEH